MIADILIQMLGPIWPYIAAAGAAVIGLVLAYLRGGANANAKAEKRDMQEEIATHERITAADTGAGVSDAVRVERLREFADRHGKRK